MKTQYPEYSQGELVELKQKIPLSDRVILEKFLQKCSINAGQQKVGKIERIILQVIDVTEKPLDKLAKEDVDNFLILLNRSNRSFWTKNENKVYLKKFLIWHYKSLEMIENIKLDSRRIDDSKINESNLITKEEFERLVRAATSFRDRTLIILEWLTGGRPQEIASSKWKDLKFYEGYAEISLYSKKTSSSRMFPINQEAVIHLKRWKQEYSYPNVRDDDFIFPSPNDRKKPLTSVSINKILRKTAKKAGITRNIWSYLFRHSLATRLYEDLPEKIAEKLMGHRGMSDIYAHISSKKVREEMLKKVYHIEELGKEEKTKIEKELNDLKKESTVQREKMEILTADLEKASRLLSELNTVSQAALNRRTNK